MEIICESCKKEFTILEKCSTLNLTCIECEGLIELEVECLYMDSVN